MEQDYRVVELIPRTSRGMTVWGRCMMTDLEHLGMAS